MTDTQLLALKLRTLVHPMLCTFGKITDDERDLILQAAEFVDDLSKKLAQETFISDALSDLLLLAHRHCPEPLQSDISDVLARFQMTR